MRALVGVDVGGTFTDVAVVHRGRLTTAKLPTSTDDQSRAVVEGVELALAAAGLSAGEIGHLGHGTTVATNALLERRGAVTGFVTTRGFGDLLGLARQTRPALYRPCVGRPSPLPAVTAELDERIGPRGVLRALDERSLDRAAARLRRAGVEAVAVCLLHSYADPASRTPRRTAAAPAPARRLRGGVASSWRPSTGSSSGRRPHRSTPTWARWWPATCRRWGGGRAAAGCLTAGGAVLRRPGRRGGAARTRPGALLSGRPAVSPGRRVASTAGSPTSHLRHGRDQLRRAPVRGGRAGGPPRARSTGCRCACRCSTSTPSGPAAGSTRGSTPAARCASDRAARRRARPGVLRPWGRGRP